MPIQVLVVESQPVVALAIRQTCNLSEFKIVAEAFSPAEAQPHLETIELDLLLVGTHLGSQSGFQFCQRTRKKLPRTLILLLASHESSANDISLAIECGAVGLIRRNSNGDQLLQTMRDACAGQRLWKRSEIKRHHAHRSRLVFDQATHRLTERENDVLMEIARGRTNSETADTLGIGYETVKDHVANILKKLEVADRTQAAIWAVQNNFV